MLPNVSEPRCKWRSSLKGPRLFAATLVVMAGAALFLLAPAAPRAQAAGNVQPKIPANVPIAEARFSSVRFLSRFPWSATPKWQQGIGADSYFLLLFPELAQAPAPDWLREGTRVTYLVQGAQIQNGPNDVPASGSSLVHYDLVALDDESAVVSVRSDTQDANRGLTPNPSYMSKGIPGAGVFWISPTVLPNAKKLADRELSVVTVPLTLGGHIYDTVLFKYTTRAAETIWQFDQASGLLLKSSVIAGQQQTMVTFQGRRRLTIPWTRAVAPDWVTAGGILEYEGTYTTMAVAMPFSITVNVDDAEDLWTQFAVTTVFRGGTTMSTTNVTGVAQLTDGYWLPAQAMDVLTNGQVLDWDPVSKASITVSRRGNGFVTLTESGPAYTIAATYSERDGVLVSIAYQFGPSTAQTVVRYQLKNRQ